MKAQTPPSEMVPLIESHEKGEPPATDASLTPPQSVDMPLAFETTSSGTLTRQVPQESQLGQAIVNLVKPIEPPVTYTEILKFFWWSVMVILSQLWKDISSGRIYKPLLRTDFTTHYFSIPALRSSPRLVTSGPYSRMKVRDDAMLDAGVFGSDELEKCSEKEVINCASNNYGGFSELEPGMTEVIEAGLRALPFCPPPKALEEHVREDMTRYMGFDEAFMAPSGFSTNILAFATIAGVAAKQGRRVIFLMDADCHNSMFTGAFYNRDAKVHKFKHNDIGDLEYKLRMYREQDPMAFVCVAIEGVYSMEGSVSIGPPVVALKRMYGFTLLVDEAHSFMAMGSDGKGSFNHWQDAGYDCPLKAVDIMSVMFSKSVGCTGGCVLANGSNFADELRLEGQKLEENKVEKLSTIILLRISGLLRKSMLIQERMSSLREKATYVASELTRAGCRILSSPGSAIICLPVGTMRQVAFFHNEAKRKGMAIVGAGPPATPIWGCRVRICIFATTSWPDIYRLLCNTVSICQEIKVLGVKPIIIDQSLLIRPEMSDALVMEQSQAINDHLVEYVGLLSKASHLPELPVGSNPDIVEAAVQGLSRYGIGPCSARWFYGSFDSFLNLENRLAKLYPSLQAQSGGGCQAMICGDAEVTLSSTITALAVRPASIKRHNKVLVPLSAPCGILKGADFNKASKFVHREYYDDAADRARILSSIPYPTHLTFYFLTCSPTGDSILDLTDLFKSDSICKVSNITGVTIMLDDRYGLGRIGPNKLGYLDYMEGLHGQGFLKKIFDPVRNANRNSKLEGRIIVAGSWYEAFGHQGGYVLGHGDTVEALTWDAKAYFFSTPPMPLQAVMTEKAIELLQSKRDRDWRGL